MATVAAIKESAAENLGIVGEGETLPSYETDDLGAAYTELHAELLSRGLVTWSVTADIPARFAWPIAMLVAEKRAVKYKVPEARYQQIKLESQEALALVRELQTRGKLGQTEIEYF